jgi:hypothetical protein
VSRQSVRQRAPVDDDLTATAEEQKRKLAESSPASTMQAPDATQTRPIARSPAAPHGTEAHGGERENYFAGRYSPFNADLGSMSPETIADQQIARFGLPASLRHCIAALLQILREHGLAAALVAMHKDAAIDKNYLDTIGLLLAAVDRDERQPRA